MPELKVKIGGDGSGFAAAAKQSIKDAQKSAKQISLAQATSAAFNSREFQRQLDVEKAARSNRARALIRERAEQRAARAEASKPPVIAPPVIPAAGKSGGGFFGGLGSGLLGGFNPAAIGASVAAALSIGTVKRYISSLDELVDHILKASETLGISTELFQQLGFAAEQTEVKGDDMNSFLEKLGKNLGEAQEGSEEAAKKFERYGISIYTAGGGLKNLEQILFEVSDAMKKTETDAQRVAMAVALGGKSGAKAIPVLRDGAAALQDMMAKAGLLSKEDIKLLDDYGDAAKALMQELMAESGGVAAALIRITGAAMDVGHAFKQAFSGGGADDLKKSALAWLALSGAGSMANTLAGRAFSGSPGPEIKFPEKDYGPWQQGTDNYENNRPTRASADSLAQLDKAQREFAHLGETSSEKLERLNSEFTRLQNVLEKQDEGSAGAINTQLQMMPIASQIKTLEMERDAQKPEEARSEKSNYAASGNAAIGLYHDGAGPGIIGDIMGRQQLVAAQQTARNTQLIAEKIDMKERGSAQTEWGER